jgi:formylglycine-generating enzyme required for sulfatase activity
MGDLPGSMIELEARFKESERQPVLGVSWYDAIEFIRKLNLRDSEFEFRLPSEAEWEYAARSGTETAFAFGESLNSDQANFNGNYPYNSKKGKYLGKTVPVGSYQPNDWGLFDMHGNVWEFVEDIYNMDYNGLSANGTPNSNGGPNLRVVRGGSWYHNGLFCRSAFRKSFIPTIQDYSYGFRLAVRPKP